MRVFIILLFSTLFIGSSCIASESKSGIVISEQMQKEYIIERDLGKAVMSWLADGNEPAALECDRLADSLLAAGEPTVKAYFYAVQVANLRQQPNKAIAILEEVIKKYPEEKCPGTSFPVKIAAPFWIATIAKQSGNISKAQKTYESILSDLDNLEGKEVLTMICNLYLAEIESDYLKRNTDALKRLNALENIPRPDEYWAAWYDMCSSWAKYRSNEISQGKSQAAQKLTPHTQASDTCVWAATQLKFCGIAGEPIAGSYKGLNIVIEILVNRTIQSEASQIDRDLARLGYGYDQQYKKNYDKAGKYLSALFQDDSFFSPVAGISLAWAKKSQEKNTEANEILEQVRKKYPGYDSFVVQVRELWNKGYEL